MAKMASGMGAGASSQACQAQAVERGVFIIRIRTGQTVLKGWRAVPIQVSNTINLSDVYDMYSRGVFDGGEPLKNEYFESAVIHVGVGQSPNAIIPAVCSLTTSEARILGMYIDFCVETMNHDEAGSHGSGGPQHEHAQEGPNVFEMMMATSRGCTSMPPRLNDVNNKTKLKNDLHDLLVELKLGWSPSNADSQGKTFINILGDALWYSDPHQKALTERNCGFPTFFSRFSGYNDPTSHGHMKGKLEEGKLSLSAGKHISVRYTFWMPNWSSTLMQSSVFRSIRHFST